MISLPYFEDPLAVYRHVAGLGDPVLLDSGGRRSTGRWDIIAAAPDAARRIHLVNHSSDALLERTLASFAKDAARAASTSTARREDAELPFHGGYIGCLSYELGRRLQGLAPRVGSLPLAVINYYPWAVVQDRREHRSWLAGDCPTVIAERLRRLLDGEQPEAGPGHFALDAPFRGAWEAADFDRVFTRVRNYIGAGDCYQINIGQPFRSRAQGDLLAAYAALRDIARAPFSAFFPLAREQTLMSLSPERFLTVDDGRVETRPIKGTRPRRADPRADRAAARELVASEKERAENLMIVDLLRNDIGRFCDTGSVHVDELFRLESYRTVHHLVSVVSGRLRAGYGAVDLLLGCLPGGSITGAPKHRAMQIIDELEPEARELWCGTLFYLSRHGRLDSNITIRTLVADGNRLTCWAGGGLVNDSRAADEFQEQRDKVGAFLDCLENF